MSRNTIKKLLFLSFSLLFLLILSPIAGAKDIYNSVIRIHVLANSDSQEDQEIKLYLRDEILEYAKEHLKPCRNRNEAKTLIEAHKTEIESVARQALDEIGSSDEVSLSLTEEYYPTRSYEGLSLPQGNYLSLQVKIGKAQGKNWWCILFPPLCLNSSSKTEDALLDAGMEQENVKTVTLQGEQYRIRFRIVEIWEKTKKSISDRFS